MNGRRFQVSAGLIKYLESQFALILLLKTKPH